MTNEQLARELADRAADRAFWMSITNILVNAALILIAAVGSGWGLWVGYLRLKLGQERNAAAIADGVEQVKTVKAMVDGHQESMQRTSVEQTAEIKSLNASQSQQVGVISELRDTVAKAVEAKVIADKVITDQAATDAKEKGCGP